MSQTEPQATPPTPRGPVDKRKLTLIAAVAVAVVLVAALLLVWSPWSSDAEPSDAGESSASASESETSTSPTPSDDSSTTTGGGSTSPQPSDDPTAGPTTGDGAESARVPTVVGMPLAQAVAEVKADFEDVRAVAQPNGAGEACTVIAQNPAGGAHPTNTRVTLTYAGTETECSP